MHTEIKKSAYDRYQEIPEDKYWKEKLGTTISDEFKIDTRGTFGTRQEKSDKQEKEDGPKKSNKREEDTFSAVVAPKKPEVKKGVPIIIVPSALTSLITLYNVKDFLLDGSYSSSIEKKDSGTKKESSVTFTRRTEGKPTYQVIDNTSKLKTKDWERVVAVFPVGANWQFKTWEWNDPVIIFSKVLGFYVRFEDEAVPETIKSWDITVLTISKIETKKHLAQTSSLAFWNAVDKFCAEKKKKFKLLK